MVNDAGIELSIIVLTHNQSALTLRLFKSLKPYLDCHPDTELILIDNGSTDSTAEDLAIAQELNSVAPFRYKGWPCNLGVAGGRNSGILVARGRLILLLDNDTLVTADAIDALREHIDTHPQCGICAPALYSPDGVLQPSAKPFPGLLLKVSHLLRPRHTLARETAELAKEHPFYVIGACQMFRQSLWEELRYLDENIFYGPEDADFCMRVRKAGYTIDYLPQIRITHDWQRATRRRPWSRLSRRHACALIYFYAKHRKIW